MLDAQDRDIRDMPVKERLALGKAMYERDILPRLTDADENMSVVMDMVSGDYEMDRRSADARIRLTRRRPDAVFHYERVGWDAPVRAVSMRRARGVGDD